MEITWYDKTLNITPLEYEPSVYRVNEIIEQEGSTTVPHELYCTVFPQLTVFYRYNGIDILIAPSRADFGINDYQRTVLLEAKHCLFAVKAAVEAAEQMFGVVEIDGRRLTVNCFDTTVCVELPMTVKTSQENIVKEKLRQIDYTLLLRRFPSDSKQAELLTALHGHGIKCPTYIDDMERLTSAGLTHPVFLIWIRPATGVFSVNNNFIIEVTDVYLGHQPASADAPLEFKTAVEVIQYLQASTK